jgi:hypothetical protein
VDVPTHTDRVYGPVEVLDEALSGEERRMTRGAGRAHATADPEEGARGLVVVSNRLPMQRSSSGWTLSPGGLVTALRPVVSRCGGKESFRVPRR